MKRAALLLVSMLQLSAGCLRIGDQEAEPPEWLFDVYSDRVVTSSGSGSVTRYTFVEDHRVLIEREFSCGSEHESWELEWTMDGPDSLILTVPEGGVDPDAVLAERWWIGLSHECESLEFGFFRLDSGARESLGDLDRGAVCGESVPPPDDWGGGEWDECSWNWCNAEPIDVCG